MELINSTRMIAGYTIGMEPSGRELLVTVVKGTFIIPDEGSPVRLAEEQVPLCLTDSFTGSPGHSAPLYELDFAPRKSRCDVLLVGSAYAPAGRPTSRVHVGLRIGAVNKTFGVVGDRYWTAGLTGVNKTPPVPFTVLPLSYDRAFGGTDNRHEDPSKHAVFMPNPVGRGFHGHHDWSWLEGAPLPNTEEVHRGIDVPNSSTYLPMSFGPIGRSWQPRAGYAGTYDERWLEEDFPFLPRDFDEQYYQAAPADQQIPHPIRDEQVVLTNLTQEGLVVFTLPVFDAPIHFFPRAGAAEEGKLVLDTIVLEPDRRRFTLTWRSSRPLRKDIFELDQVLVGKQGSEWWAIRRSVEFPIPLAVVMDERDEDKDEEDEEEEEDDRKHTDGAPTDEHES